MIFNEYVFKYKTTFKYNNIYKEYNAIYPSVELYDTISLEEYSFIINNLNYSTPNYLTILNTITMFLIFPINVLLFIFHRNTLVQFIFLIFLLFLAILVLACNLFELYLPKKRLTSFVDELNNEYANRMISFRINSDNNLVLIYPFPDHFYNIIPQPFQQQQQQQQQQQNIQSNDKMNNIYNNYLNECIKENNNTNSMIINQPPHIQTYPSYESIVSNTPLILENKENSYIIDFNHFSQIV